MIKKKTLVFICIAAALVIVGITVISTSGVTVSTGRCVVSDSGRTLWISNTGEPVVMETGENKDLFNNLSTGDKIMIVRQNAIAESYPGRVRVYACIKLSEGNDVDIPVETLEALKELGWIK